MLRANKALLPDKFSAALQICRRARRYSSSSSSRNVKVLWMK
nr:hypothetical protein [uncultured bacterium]